MPRCASPGTTASAHGAGEPIAFAQLPFDHPLYILYSSGTTGVPKCIVHGAGGTLLQHLKEHLLHSDMQPRRPRVLLHHLRLDDVELAGHGARLRGDAAALRRLARSIPTRNVLWDFADAGAHDASSAPRPSTSTPASKAGRRAERDARPVDACALIISTGSPLAPESFDYVYATSRPTCSSPRSRGGTDIVSCFVLGNPTLPVWRGEIQMPRARHGGRRLRRRRPAGASARRASWSAPSRSRRCRSASGTTPTAASTARAYFERFPGRLAPRRLRRDHRARRRRSSTAARTPCSTPAACASARPRSTARSSSCPRCWRALVHRPGLGGRRARRAVRAAARRASRSTTRCAKRIREQIRAQHHAAPRAGEDRPGRRHPAHAVSKIVELAVRDVVHGRPVKNSEALANPEALDLFRDLED